MDVLEVPAGESAMILIADDSPVFRDLISIILSRSGYDVIEASDGLAVLALAKAHPVECILMDVMMPGMDGLEVCRRLKGDPATADIPIVLVSASLDVDNRREGLEAGAEDVVGKPIGLVDLLRVVRRCVQGGA